RRRHGSQLRQRAHQQPAPQGLRTTVSTVNWSPVRILTRYIRKEVLSHAFLGGLLFTFVLVMPNLPSLMELIVRNSASLGVVGEIFLLTLPNMLTVTIPMAVLVGILLGLSRLAADSE